MRVSTGYTIEQHPYSEELFSKTKNLFIELARMGTFISFPPNQLVTNKLPIIKSQRESSVILKFVVKIFKNMPILFEYKLFQFFIVIGPVILF